MNVFCTPGQLSFAQDWMCKTCRLTSVIQCDEEVRLAPSSLFQRWYVLQANPLIKSTESWKTGCSEFVVELVFTMECAYLRLPVYCFVLSPPNVSTKYSSRAEHICQTTTFLVPFREALCVFSPFPSKVNAAYFRHQMASIDRCEL